MKQISTKLKNVVTEEITTKQLFSKFLSHFNTLSRSKTLAGFYSYDNRNVDYNFLADIAIKSGMSKKDIPTEEQLSQLF